MEVAVAPDGVVPRALVADIEACFDLMVCGSVDAEGIFGDAGIGALEGRYYV